MVISACGYPNTYNMGEIIMELNQTHDENSKVFHAGTKRDWGKHCSQ